MGQPRCSIQTGHQRGELIPPCGFFQSQLAEEIDKLRSELDQFRLRAGSLTDATLSRWVFASRPPRPPARSGVIPARP